MRSWVGLVGGTLARAQVRRLGVLGLACALGATSACAAEPDGDDGAGDDTAEANGAKHALIALPPGTMVDGFAVGRLRRARDVGALRITRHPITRAQFQECVDAGACGKADEPGCDPQRDLGAFDLDGKRAPAVCVGLRNAAAFCSWSGGRLPKLSEWLYAARGIEPRRYSWGDTAPDCERHPRAERFVPPTGEEEGQLVTTAPCAVVDAKGKLEVGAHRSGASPFGMEDVLLTPMELLSTEPDPLLSACHSASPACAIGGSAVGAIETVVPIRPAVGEGAVRAVPTYGFRCVVEGE